MTMASRVREEYYILSLLANRIASVCGSGSPSLTSAAAFHTQLRSLPTLGESFMSGTTAYDKSFVSHGLLSRCIPLFFKDT